MSTYFLRQSNYWTKIKDLDLCVVQQEELHQEQVFLFHQSKNTSSGSGGRSKNLGVHIFNARYFEGSSFAYLLSKIWGCKWTSCIPSSTVPEQTTVYNGLKSFLKQYSHFYVKYRGPILHVTSPVLGSDDLSLDQSGTSIQILIEPNAATWHVSYKIFFRPSFRLLCLLKSLECINLDPLCIIASLRTSYLVQVFESMYYVKCAPFLNMIDR